MSLERLKRLVRYVEAASTPRVRVLEIHGQTVTVCRSRWWDDDQSDADFVGDVAPYFEGLPPRRYRGVVDVGAASGLFAIPLLKTDPEMRVVAFEPSRRQRMLLRRNLRKNGVAARVSIESAALWDREQQLAFRSHGYLSSVRGIGAIPLSFAHDERVQGLPLDVWSKRQPGFHIDLLKMDIEGAELEALAGATEVLAVHRPICLIQAYHLRDGARTFERCAALLEGFRYRCREVVPREGLIQATPDD